MLQYVSKFSLFSVLFFQISGLFFSQEKINLRIEIETTKYNKGQIAIALFDDAEQFLNTPLISKAEKVKDNKVVFLFNSLPTGTYSFSYFHDLNLNDELDTNFMGIPKEPYGFSNNKQGRFGPPDFEECKILLEKDTTLKLTIK
jgi:uncharacterized protein (DUF2141 family)